ncbi:unnamed protein product [Parajaminaea phylloscopi]
MAPAKASSAGPRILYWFRTDLRLHDSPALAKALAASPSALFPVFCWDPNYIYGHRTGVRRLRFLLESMQDLSDEIRKVNSNSQLLVVRGNPQTRIKEVCEKWQITHVAFEEDHHGYGRKRDEEIRKVLGDAKIEIISVEGRHLYPLKEVLAKNKNQPPTSMSAYQKAVQSFGDVPKPAETPESLPDPLAPGSDKVDLGQLYKLIGDLTPFAKSPGPPKIDLNAADMGGQRREGKDGAVTCYETVASQEKQGKDAFAVPTLASLGMDEPEDKLCAKVKGGSSEALRRLKELTKDPAYLATFAKPKTSPSTDPDAPSTTLLSPYIKFGCLGVRHFWHTMKETKRKYKGGGKTDVPEGMEGQMLFRDMYAAVYTALGDDYTQVRGNPICKYVDWYLPNVYDKDGNKIEPRPPGDEESEKRLAAWKAGQTGFPWIDANMRMLRACGWMHHLGRHSVAAFLTRGQCFISWERGAEVFDEYLLDWDPASNAGNWMWLSASAFFSQFFRVYGLATFPAKYDKSGYLVRKFCPELKDFPDRYIYAPWTAPQDVQKKAKCIIGQDYPAPILDEKVEKQHCLDRMGYAYKQKLMGNAKEVLNGSAEEKFRKGHGIEHPGFNKEGRQDKKIPDWAKAGHEADPNLENSKKSQGETSDEAPAKSAKDDDQDEMQPHETDDHDHDHDRETKEEVEEAADEEDDEPETGDTQDGEKKGDAKAQKGTKRKNEDAEASAEKGEQSPKAKAAKKRSK